jgi:hypothetical protein
MNKQDIRLLQSVRGYPALSILVPTHRTSPDNQQDPIRVKNLVDEAKNRLLDEFNQREIAPLFEKLDELVNDIDYMYALDGLAIFVSADFAEKYYIPFTLTPRVVVDETFATRDLVKAMNRTNRYWVVALSEQPTRLFEASRDSLTEVTDFGFPMELGRMGGERGAQSERMSQGAYRDEHHRKFFRDVVDGVVEARKADALPVAVIGVDRYIAFFDELFPQNDAIIGTLNGNYDHATPHEIGQLIWPEVKEAFANKRHEVLDELGTAIGARRFVSTVGEVWEYAHDGRGDVLVVEDSFKYPARVSEDGRRISKVEQEEIEAPDVVDDAVDEIIEAVMLQGGRVEFVDDGALEDHRGIALITRY